MRSSRSSAALVGSALLSLGLVASACSSAVTTAGAGEVGVTEAAVEQTAPISLGGDPLPNHPEEGGISVDAAGDPGIGLVAPTLTATSFDGSTVEIGPGGQPTILLFVAHWCPHCQDEVPMVEGLVSDGRFPDDVRVVAVSTGINPEASNYPPSAWFETEGWSSLAVRDDADSSLMRGFGGIAFPYAVFLDANNVVVARSIGSVGAEQMVQLAERIGDS